MFDELLDSNIKNSNLGQIGEAASAHKLQNPASPNYGFSITAQALVIAEMK